MSGYGLVKDASVKIYRLRLEKLLGAFAAASVQPQPLAA
jgi:hypothetical protein